MLEFQSVAYTDMKNSPLSLKSKGWKKSYVANGLCAVNSIRLFAIVWFMQGFSPDVRVCVFVAKNRTLFADD